jgi:hypothetical protein
MTETRAPYKTKLTGQGGPGRGQGRKPLPLEQRRKKVMITLTQREIQLMKSIVAARNLKGQGYAVALGLEAIAKMEGITTLYDKPEQQKQRPQP